MVVKFYSMRKKMKQKRRNWLMCFVILVLVFGLSGSAFAYNDVFWDGSESSDWTNGDNWDTGNVPVDGSTGDYALIGDPTVTQPIIVSGDDVSASRVVVGQVNSGCTLEVQTGGKVTSTHVNVTVGRGGGSGTLNISGGTVIADAGFLLGNDVVSTGVVKMTGGTLTVHADMARGN